MAGTEWIVKLIPIGNPESKLYVIETVGGASGTNDFIGWHLDQFTFTTHATLATATVLLAHAPSSIASCYCLVAESQRIITPTSLSGSSLTVTKYGLLYDKPATNTGVPTAVPSGVTIETTNSRTAAALDAGGTGNALRDGTLFDHKHALSFAQVSLPLAVSESTRMVVLYK